MNQLFVGSPDAFAPEKKISVFMPSAPEKVESPSPEDEKFFDEAPAGGPSNFLAKYEEQAREDRKIMIAERKGWPNASRLRPWGENNFVGMLLPNEECFTEGGVLIPNTHECQDIPSACLIMAVSPAITQKPATLIEWLKHQIYPYLPKRLAFLRDRFPVAYWTPYPELKVGNYVFLTQGAGDRWPGYDGNEYVMANGRNVRGGYSRFWTEADEQSVLQANAISATSAKQEQHNG